ncbi:MAG: uroporphyrinogen decarboxylase family protein [Candidatus Promineifilaceae bacterium]|nr:uroporphyrinogen decarboxylase family protein [Candidatus Promineifilaceae bacterium]
MAAWSKRKRLETALNGEKPDRVPVALWRHFPGDDQDAGALAAAHIQWQHDYDWDVLKVSPASSYCLVDWGVEARWEGSLEGTRTYTKRVIQEADDWTRLERLDPHRGMLATQLEALRLVGAGLRAGAGPELDGETPYLATIFSPLAQAKNLAGGERLLSHMRSHPEAVRAGLETITQSTIDYVEAAKDTGISGIFYAIQHARYPLLNMGEYQIFGRSLDEEILAAASDLWLNMVHLHGEEGVIFEMVADYPVQIVNWHDRDSSVGLGEGLQQFSGLVCGGVSRWSIYEEGPQKTLAEARAALQETDGQRFMLGVGCVVMTNTPLRNIRALRDVVETGGESATE